MNLLDVAIHVIGHALGIGAIWDDLGLVRGIGTSKPTYVGRWGMNEYTNLVGVAFGTPVPLANTGGAGDQGSHWRESVFGTVLMTGFIGNTNQISRVTVGALRDMGYTVDFHAADAYSPPVTATASTASVSSLLRSCEMKSTQRPHKVSDFKTANHRLVRAVATLMLRA